MPQHFIYETAITIDHEANELRLDTTRAGIAARCTRVRMVEVTEPESRPYRRFVGFPDQILIRKGKRPASTGRPENFKSKRQKYAQVAIRGAKKTQAGPIP